MCGPAEDCDRNQSKKLPLAELFKVPETTVLLAVAEGVGDDGEILQIIRAGEKTDVVGRHIRVVITAEQINAHVIVENGIAADGIVGGARVV